MADPEYSLPIKSFESVNSSHNQVNWFIHTAESHLFTACDLNLLIQHKKKKKRLFYFGNVSWIKVNILKLCVVFLSSSGWHAAQYCTKPVFLAGPKKWCRCCLHYLACSDPFNKDFTKSSWGSHQFFNKSLWSAKQQISWKPHLKGTITPSLITESTTSSSDSGQNCSVENNVLLGLAPPKSFPRAKVKFW